MNQCLDSTAVESENQKLLAVYKGSVVSQFRDLFNMFNHHSWVVRDDPPGCWGDVQMVSNGIKWHQMVSNGIKWYQMVSNDIKCPFHLCNPAGLRMICMLRAANLDGCPG